MLELMRSLQDVTLAKRIISYSMYSLLPELQEPF